MFSEINLLEYQNIISEMLNNLDQTEPLCSLRKIKFELNLLFYSAEILYNIAKVFKTEIVICGKAISLALLTELYGQDRNDRIARQRLKERLQIIFPELLFLSFSKIYRKLLLQTSIISRAWILSSQARKTCFDLLSMSYKQIYKI